MLLRQCKNTVALSKLILSNKSKGAPNAINKSFRYAHAATSALPVAKYGGRYTVTMLPGHGIGPEMMTYVREVFRYAGVPLDFEEINLDSMSDTQEEIENAITSIKRNGVAIKGNIETKVHNPNFLSRNVEIRNELDLYAYVLHCHTFPSLPTRHGDIDVVIVRQNIEGEYSMQEHENVKGVVESLKIITRENSKRLARFAFEYAEQHNRKKVTAVHKANIMKLSDGLFLETCASVAKDFPNIEFNNMIVDNCCMQLVSRPQQFDVLIMPNLYGTVISNLVCGLVGGPGLVAGTNHGEKYAIFEPGTRNTGDGLMGKNIANPIAMLEAAVLMLKHLGLDWHAKLIGSSITKTLEDPKMHTPDLHGQATTTEVVQNIIHELQKQTQVSNW